MEGRLTHWEGEPIRVWESLWAIPRFEAFYSLSSTNDRIRDLAGAGAPEYCVVTAEEQTRGRGRGGTHWSSPPGKGLWVSVLLRPGPEVSRAVIPVLLGLAAARAIEAVAPGLHAGLKWPNDVLLGGRKVCGILCESSGEGAVVAGIGVNLRQKPGDFPAELRERAVSVEEAAGTRVSRSTLAGGLVTEARRLLSSSLAGMQETVVAELELRDVLRGRRVRCAAGVEGVARGIDSSGALLVESRGGVLRVTGGSVRVVEGLRSAPCGSATPTAVREKSEGSGG